MELSLENTWEKKIATIFLILEGLRKNFLSTVTIFLIGGPQPPGTRLFSLDVVGTYPFIPTDDTCWTRKL